MNCNDDDNNLHQTAMGIGEGVNIDSNDNDDCEDGSGERIV